MGHEASRCGPFVWAGAATRITVAQHADPDLQFLTQLRWQIGDSIVNEHGQSVGVVIEEQSVDVGAVQDMEHAPCRDLQWAERVHGAGFDRLTGFVARREQLQPVSNLPSGERSSLAARPTRRRDLRTGREVGWRGGLSELARRISAAGRTASVALPPSRVSRRRARVPVPQPQRGRVSVRGLPRKDSMPAKNSW